MTTRRIMGTEVEYGISVPGAPEANPILTSSMVVAAYGNRPELNRRGRTHWDYEAESPMSDARGFSYAGGLYDPAADLMDEDSSVANLILTNGARLYVDHAHPEFSGPEVTNPRDAVLYDKAGELVMLEATRLAAKASGNPRMLLYKNNTDNKGASYGAHENYLMSRATPFADIVNLLIPFLVTRQVVCGAGRVGLGSDTVFAGYQISQRADFFEVEVGLETTLKRPIINTRDEPHADADAFRRLHVIIGDANLSEISLLLKTGTTALVLAMIEDKAITRDLTLADPVAEVRAVSHDPSLTHKLRLADGRQLTALEVQQEYCARAAKYVADRQGSDTDEQTADVLSRWQSVLDRLGTDVMSLSRELDWVAKLALLEGYRSRDALEWHHPRLALVDLQYSDIRPDKGLYNKLVSTGRMQRILTDEQISAAVMEPPEDTRAYFRGRCVSGFGESLVAAGWDSVVFDVGRPSLVRIPMMQPERGTKAHVGGLMDNAIDAEQLLGALEK